MAAESDVERDTMTARLIEALGPIVLRDPDSRSGRRLTPNQYVAPIVEFLLIVKKRGHPPW